MTDIINIRVEYLHPHPGNPRKELGDLTELAASIKANGIFQNLTVVPGHAVSDNELSQECARAGVEPCEELRQSISATGFTVVIGHRRLAAAQLAGLDELPCIIAEMTPQEQLRTMLMENMQRSDLTVYEQAQGFQAMIDLGDTVETVARETGFSPTTVRRRLKMMELDQVRLKEVSARQLSLADFDELAKIEDIAARNECLETIGTSDFKIKVATALRRQNTSKMLPLARGQLKGAGIKSISSKEIYGTKYEQLYNKTVYLYEWDGTSSIIPKVKGQLYYHLESDFGALRFFTERKRADPVKRSREDIEKEKLIAELWSSFEEKAAVAFELRKAFVDSLSLTHKNAIQILRGALIAGVLEAVDFNSPDRGALKSIFQLDPDCYDNSRGQKVLAALQTVDNGDIPKAIYALFGDGKERGYAVGYKKSKPKYERCNMLDGLYLWLTGMGYEMSSEERALQDGTHELFHTEVTVHAD